MIKYSLIFGVLSICLACTPKLSLQSYFVDHQETAGFMAVDIPMSFINPDKIELTEIQNEAVASIDKLNMLAYSLKDGTEEEFLSEVAKVKTILKADVYNDLIRAGNTTDGKVQVMYIGNDTEIDELIIFGVSSEYGFAIVRVLGDDMELSKIMKLRSVADQFDTKNANIEDFMKFLL